jgi:hypothetical protein
MNGGALAACFDAVAGRLAEAGGLACTAFAGEIAALPRAAAETAPPQARSGRLPVLGHWPAALAGAAAVDPGLAAALTDLSPALGWRQNPNYVRRPPSADFLDGYGYAVIAGPGGLAPAPIALGVLLLAPEVLYPAHAHPAEEVYLVLDGASRWWREGEGWREGLGGAAIHHPPMLAHAMQAGAAPLLAIYLWRGDLATNAALTPSSA